MFFDNKKPKDIYNKFINFRKTKNDLNSTKSEGSNNDRLNTNYQDETYNMVDQSFQEKYAIDPEEKMFMDRQKKRKLEKQREVKEKSEVIKYSAFWLKKHSKLDRNDLKYVPEKQNKSGDQRHETLEYRDILKECEPDLLRRKTEYKHYTYQNRPLGDIVHHSLDEKSHKEIVADTLRETTEFLKKQNLKNAIIKSQKERASSSLTFDKHNSFLINLNHRKKLIEMRSEKVFDKIS